MLTSASRSSLPLPIDRDLLSSPRCSPLSGVAFTLLALEAEEGLSRPFRYLATVRADKADADVASLLGKIASVTLTADGKAKRLFSGIVAEAGQLDADPRGASYRLDIRPALWLLSLAGDCRIFQQKSLSDIAKTVLKADGDGFAWRYDSGDRLNDVLWPVLWDAAALLTGDSLGKVGHCHNDICGWFFIDHSRNRSRRWCSMDSCGNRAKARRHYARNRAGSDAENSSRVDG